MGERADVVIVGGGIIGTSIAFHLASLGVTDVLLLERSAVAAGSTGRSVGIIETSYAPEVDVALAKAGFEEFMRFPEIVGGTADFHQRLHIEAVATPEQVHHLEAIRATAHEHGLHPRIVSPDEMTEVFPELRVDDLEAGLLSEEAGFCDPHSAARSYAESAQRRGVRVQTKSKVERVLVERGEVAGVRTATEDVRAPIVVNAAGPWANELNHSLGFQLPLSLWQRQIFVTTPHPQIPGDRPLFIDLPGRFYFRQELDGGFVLGLVEDNVAQEQQLAEPETDWDFKIRAVEAAVHRVPKLAETGIANGWSGIVTFTPDQLPILGPVKEAKGFFLANGMSGYGVMISPGVGLALAEMIAGGESKTIDVSALRYDRFDGKPETESAGLWFIRG